MSATSDAADKTEKKCHFLHAIIEGDLQRGVNQQVRTRFPPEPNGYLHIGHAKSICLNFGLARDFGGFCHLRFDDTNPTKEEVEYVESIKNDVRWLGFDWGPNLYHASDFFQQMYELAVDLIERGLAYVCRLDEEAFRAVRGTIKEPGGESPYRNTSPAENLALFEEMRQGIHPEGSMVLRAKIDMTHPNMKMRDPALYRILRVPHDRTGDTWKIYPMYDYAHPLEDAYEHITHSICTLEFENNRDIYDWVLEHTKAPCRPRQYEFARLFLNYTVMSKRKLLSLVQNQLVAGWDDPRMPTLAAMRRRGYTPAAIRAFCDRIGVAKANSMVDIGMLEFCVRDDLNHQARRVMAVLDPVKLIIDDFPADQVKLLDAPSYPHDVPREGSRPVPFRRELYIERDDFSENPPKNYFRLAPGQEVRLRYAYVVKCTGVVVDESGRITEIHCSHDPATLGHNPSDRKINGTIHWVPAVEALPAEVRLYDRLFNVEQPDTFEDYRTCLNPDSLRIVQALVEPSLATDPAASHYQFERLGYFFSDPTDSAPGHLVFNRTVGLRDSWAKQEAPAGPVEKKEPVSKAPAPQVEVKRELDPETQARIETMQASYGISAAEAETLIHNELAASWFERTLALIHQPKLVAAWVNNELLRALKERSGEALPFGPSELAELLGLIENGTISATAAKEVFGEMQLSGARPAQIVEDKGLRQVSDDAALAAIIDQVLAANPDELARYRAGEKKLQGFFMGQIMKASGGKANPALLKNLLPQKLGNLGG